MKPKITIFLLIGLTLILNHSCKKKTTECVSYEQTAVSLIQGPETGQINQEIQLTVISSGYNGCAQSGKFQEDIDESIRTIKLLLRYEGCYCTQAFIEVATLYTFKTSQQGVYTLRFLGADDQYVEHVITVE